MTDKIEQYVKYLESRKYAQTYRTEKKLIKMFGNKLGFWHPSCKSETAIVYAMDVHIEQKIEIDVSTSQNSEEKSICECKCWQVKCCV